MNIRPAVATLEEADAMIAASVSPGVGRRRVQKALERLDTDLVLVATESKRVIGWASAGYRTEGYSYPGWYCLQIHVAVDRRGQHVGSALMEERLRWLSEQGASEVFDARPENSTTWIGRWGFEPHAADFTLNGVRPKDDSWILFRAPIL